MDSVLFIESLGHRNGGVHLRVETTKRVAEQSASSVQSVRMVWKFARNAVSEKHRVRARDFRDNSMSG